SAGRALGGGAYGSGGMLADAVVSLSGRYRVGEATRAPGAGPERGAPNRQRRPGAAGARGGAEPAMADGPRAPPGPAGPATGIERRSCLCPNWLKGITQQLRNFGHKLSRLRTFLSYVVIGPYCWRRLPGA